MFVFMGNFTSSPFGKDSSDVLEYKHHFDALADLLLGKRREVGVCGTGGRTAKEHHHCVLPPMKTTRHGWLTIAVLLVLGVFSFMCVSARCPMTPTL